jgi:phosphoribosylformylglycinamidine synthase
MPARLEITLAPDLFDAEGAAICRKANDYFGLDLESVRTVSILTIDIDLSTDQLEVIRTEIFTNPITQISSYSPLPTDFDSVLWVGYRPGVRDNPGSTAAEAVEDLLGIRLKPHEAIYTSKRYCLKGGNLSFNDAERITRELLANDIIPLL